QPRQRAIAGRAVAGELGEGSLGLLMLAGFGERHRGFEGGAGFGRLLGLPPVIAAPAADRDDDKDATDNGEVAVALPQLLQLLAPDFFIDFLKNVGHGPSPTPANKTRPKLRNKPVPNAPRGRSRLTVSNAGSLTKSGPETPGKRRRN